jgi:16S rRNA (guanine527-N7)-methyltransferase
VTVAAGAPPIVDEEASRAWLGALPGVSRETIEQLERFAALTHAASAEQNLVAASTLGPAFWARHIVDSAQLLPLVPDSLARSGGKWVDLGSGAGMPGLVIAILSPQWHVTLVESRRLRCAHLAHMVDALALSSRVTVCHARVETLKPRRFDVISARAFAPLDRLLATARHLAGPNTRWLLPKGRNAALELSTLPPAWQRCFELAPSLTDPASAILVGTGAMTAPR